MATTLQDNIVIFGGAKVYTAAFGETFPLATIAFGTAWGGGWTNRGLLPEGYKAVIEHKVEKKKVRSDTYNGAIVRAVDGNPDVNLTMPLLEDTFDNIKYQVGSGTLTLGSTEDTFEAGTTTLNPSEFALGLEGYGTGTKDATIRYRRYVFFRCQADEGLNQELTLLDATTVETKWCVLADTSKSSGKEFYKIVNRVI